MFTSFFRREGYRSGEFHESERAEMIMMIDDKIHREVIRYHGIFCRVEETTTECVTVTRVCLSRGEGPLFHDHEREAKCGPTTSFAHTYSSLMTS